MNWVIQTDSFTIWKPEIQNQFHCDKTKVSVGPCSLQRLLGDSVSLPYQLLVQHFLAYGPFLHLHGCSVASTDLYPLASSYNFYLLCQMFFSLILAAAAAKSLQLGLTLCDPRDRSPPGSAVPGILQARTLEWVAISFSKPSTRTSDKY